MQKPRHIFDEELPYENSALRKNLKLSRPAKIVLQVSTVGKNSSFVTAEQG